MVPEWLLGCGASTRDLQELVRSSLIRYELAAPEKKKGGGAAQLKS